MRKNTARHWLHATLDLLPVILIPVFMIYSHRHDLSTDITIQQDVYKDFYQGVKNGKPVDLENWSFTNTDNYQLNSYEQIYCINNENGTITYQQNYDYLENNIYAFVMYLQNTDDNSANIHFQDDDIIDLTIQYNDINTRYVELFQYDYDATNLSFYFVFDEDYQEILLSNFQIFNLTTIFGSGNEPTKEVFESYLTQDYYDFGSNQVKVGTIDVQAKNNDIMSVFMDSFNNSIDRYFNMGNVFNMASVYNWFNTNIFNGQAPTVIFSVWNIVLYEFVMDLLFLLYGLFMWFIDMCKRLMEKPLDSIK